MISLSNRIRDMLNKGHLSPRHNLGDLLHEAIVEAVARKIDEISIAGTIEGLVTKKDLEVLLENKTDTTLRDYVNSLASELESLSDMVSVANVLSGKIDSLKAALLALTAKMDTDSADTDGDDDYTDIIGALLT